MSRRTPRGNTFQPDVYATVLSLLPKDREAQILDAGAGEGHFCDLLGRNGYVNLAACDHDATQFKVSGVRFRSADLCESLPFDDETFDCVVSIEVVEHIANHPRYFAELFRVLRKGGVAIVTTPNIQSLPSRLHFLVHGNTDGARRPLDPARESWQQHTHCLGIQQFLYYTSHHGASIETIATNRMRRSGLLMLPLYPLLFLLMLSRLRRGRYRERGRLYWRYLRAVLTFPALVGRILVVVARKQ
jgi:SAM-dependent methyltransferase